MTEPPSRPGGLPPPARCHDTAHTSVRSDCVIPLEDEAGAEDETVAQRDNEPLIVKTMQCLADVIETSERAQVVRLDV